MFTGAMVDGATLTLTYNEALGTSTPATGDFNVQVAGARRTVSSVSVTGTKVLLTLSSAVTAGQTVTITYTAGTNPIEDAAGNDAPSISTAEAVTNATPLPVADAPSVSIDSVPAGNENTSVLLTATVSGGAYDTIEHAWSVSGGTLDDATAASPEWTRPAVTSDTDYDINLTITARGNGSTARNGTSDTATAAEVTARVRNAAALPVADAPSIVIDSVPAGNENTTVTLGATLSGGAYDTIEHAWSVSGGTLDDATAASPVWTRPAVTSDRDFVVSLRVTVSGTGVTTRNGTFDSHANSILGTVRNVAALPVADAPSVSIDSVPAGNENTTVTLGATLSGGAYDTIEHAWSVSGGTLDDATAASPVWTRPAVTSDTDYDINLTITARGNGSTARNGTSDTATAAEVTARVRNVAALPVADAPSVSIDSVPAGNENTRVLLTATVSGGAYDTIEHAWSVSGGTLDDATAASPEWTRPAVTSDTDYDINLTITARGNGSTARNGTSDTATAAEVTARVRNVAALPVADAPSIVIDSVPAGNENTTVTLGATLSGGAYDTIEHAWSVSGGTLDDATAASPVWTRPAVTSDTDYDINLTITARGNGSTARNGTSDTATAAEVTARVRNVAAPPVTDPDPDIDINPDGSIKFPPPAPFPPDGPTDFPPLPVLPPITVSIASVEAISANAPAVILTANTSHTPERWIWDWGDGFYDRGANLTRPPMHVYRRSGTYTITVTVERGQPGNLVSGKDRRTITVTAPATDTNRSALYRNADDCD